MPTDRPTKADHPHQRSCKLLFTFFMNKEDTLFKRFSFVCRNITDVLCCHGFQGLLVFFFFLTSLTPEISHSLIFHISYSISVPVFSESASGVMGNDIYVR